MTEQSSTTLYYWPNKFDLTCWNRPAGEVQNLEKDHLAVLTTVHFICCSTLDFNLKLSMNAYPAATAWEKTHGMQETWRKTDYWQQAHSIVGFHFPNTSCFICFCIFSWDTFQFSKKIACVFSKNLNEFCCCTIFSRLIQQCIFQASRFSSYLSPNG